MVKKTQFQISEGLFNKEQFRKSEAVAIGEMSKACRPIRFVELVEDSDVYRRNYKRDTRLPKMAVSRVEPMKLAWRPYLNR